MGPLLRAAEEGESQGKKKPGRATATAKAALVSPKRIRQKLQDCLQLRSPSVLMDSCGGVERESRSGALGEGEDTYDTSHAPIAHAYIHIPAAS